MLSETEQELQNLQKEYVTAQTVIKDKNEIIQNQVNQVNEYIQAMHGAKEEQQTYLMQIAKLQDLLHQTEGEIKEIEAGHEDVLRQMQAEVKRAESRAGQLERADPSESNLVRNRHLRTILQESDVGKIVLYLVDYFERKKVRTLALDTLSAELGISPIIARKHLRYLHELRICNLNEVTREIKLVS
jgi:chromosome segregation ATPase